MGSRNLDQVYDVGDQLAHQNSPFLLLFKALERDYQVGYNHAQLKMEGQSLWQKYLEFWVKKTCSFIRENRTKNGPLVFRTVLCSKHDEKLGN